MGKLVFTKTIKPFRVYVYDNNEEGRRIILNAYTETSNNIKYIRKFAISESEFPKFLELLLKLEIDLKRDLICLTDMKE